VQPRGAGIRFAGMRRVLVSLLVLAALAAPSAAGAAPAPPDPTAPALVGTPTLVARGAHRVTLGVRFDRPLPRRFDGEPLATAAIDGRIASLAPVGRRGTCDEARAWITHAETGRLVAVSVSVAGAAPVTVSTLVAIAAPRPPHGHGALPGC
jgi:hypothetical protein